MTFLIAAVYPFFDLCEPLFSVLFLVMLVATNQ